VAKALQDILGWVALTKAVNAVKDGVPNPLPPYLFEVRSESKVVGDSVKFNRTYGQRQTARRAEYGAASRRRAMAREELVEVKLIHFFEDQPIPPLVMQQLRDYDSYDNQQKGMRVVASNVKKFGTLFANTRIVAVTTSLSRGAIYFDADGNLLPDSTGAAFTFSQQIPSDNVGTVKDEAGANIFGASGGGSWANAATDIPLQIRRLIAAAAATHGYEPRVALYGRNIPSYFATNNYVKEYLSRNPEFRTAYVRDNTVPAGLFGIDEWVPAWKASYEKYDGTKVPLWGADTVTFLPGREDLGEWWEFFEGSYLVPRTLNIVADAAAAIGNMEQVFGAFGYGALTHNPPSVATYMGDTFFPAVKNGNVVYIANVVS
jgi:hypothetical protein